MRRNMSYHELQARRQMRITVWAMVALAALAALVIVPQSCSAETIVGAHVGTWHDKPGFNNVNPGAYVVHDGWTAGAYRNSERGTSAYAGHTFETDDRRFALLVGAVIGYRNAPIKAMALPSLRIGSDDLAARLTFVPRAEKGGTNAVHFSIEVRL
jgi:hypothetical protein